MEKPAFIAAKEVSEALACSMGKAYSIIRQLNMELKEKGYIAPIAGKTSRRFWEERFYGYSDEGAASDSRLQQCSGRP